VRYAIFYIIGHNYKALTIEDIRLPGDELPKQVTDTTADDELKELVMAEIEQGVKWRKDG
jgi:hypothetical protein